jgi:2-polyprenyl-6-methoxyphenol hydroxylase-like FAD-dependent oxidoreductase
MEILIAGGGIAGLAAAIALRQTGHEVQVLEGSSGHPELGAGLAIWPNGWRAMAQLGLAEVPGCTVRRLEIRNAHDHLLSVPPVADLKGRYGYELILVHRADLHALLLDGLSPTAVRFGSEIARFEQDRRRVRVSLRSGEVLEADLLVGADGIRSAVRAGLLADGQPHFSGATCWRGVAPFRLDDGTAVNWWGSGGECGVFPLSDGRVYWFAVQSRAHGEADTPAGRKADVMQAFASWPAIIGSVIQATEAGAILRNDLYDRPPARSWSQGRVTLIGDAAHPMLPNVAQGACQALCDAAVLGVSLASHAIEDAFNLYEARRMRPANRLVSQARQTARMIQSTNPILTAARDFVVAHAPSTLFLRQLDALMR